MRARSGGETGAPPAGEAGGRRGSQRFRPADRVRRSSEYRRAQRFGERVHSRHFLFVVHPRQDGDERARLGLTVSRKVGGAVRRNRVKRLLREVFRRNRELFPKGCDVVVIAKRGAPALGYRDVLQEVRSVRAVLARKARVAARRLARAEQGGKVEG